MIILKRTSQFSELAGVFLNPKSDKLLDSNEQRGD